MDTLDAVLAAMRTFPASSKLQKNGSFAISILLHRHQKLHARFMRVGGLQLLTSALRRHADAADVCEAACLAVSNVDRLIANSAVPAAEAQAALHAIVAAMRAHSTHVPTQEFGMHTLCALSLHSAVVPLMASSGAILAVLNAMEAHPMDVCVQSAGCMALCSFFLKHEPHRKTAVESGAIKVLVGALRASYSRTAVCAGAAVFSARYARNANDDPKSFAILALGFFYGHTQGAPIVQAELFSESLALHEGALGLLQRHRMRASDGTGAEQKRIEMVQVFTVAAAFHVATCPDCTGCAARRARGEMCGLKGCAACAPAGAAGGSNATSTNRLQVCSRCRTVAYCCAEHQRRDWGVHKPACKALRRAAEAAAAAEAGASAQ